MSSNEKQKVYRINHSYKPEIIVPIVAVDNNIDFICAKGDSRDIVTADNIICIANDVLFQNICDLEEKVLSLYHISAWDFLKKWRAVYPEYLDSLIFVTMKLVKNGR